MKKLADFMPALRRGFCHVEGYSHGSDPSGRTVACPDLAILGHRRRVLAESDSLTFRRASPRRDSRKPALSQVEWAGVAT